MKSMHYIFLLLLLGSGLRAQDATISMDVDSTTYLIGEWIALHLTVEAPAQWNLRMPSQDDDFADAEFVSAEELQREVTGDRQKLQQTCIVTVFDTGRIPISAILRYSKPDDTTTYSLASDAVTFEITTVELDTTITFKDIRDVLDVPLTMWDYLLYAGVVALVALLAWFGYRWYRNHGEEMEEVPETEPDLPAHVIALRALEGIRNEELWQSGRHKLYQSRVTDVLRGYIERRFDIPALEHPTSEIIPDVAMLGLEPSQVGALENVLRTADLTKFAKHVPSVKENEEAMNFSVGFVEETKQEDQAPSVEQSSETPSVTSVTPEPDGSMDVMPEATKEGGDV